MHQARAEDVLLAVLELNPKGPISRQVSRNFLAEAFDVLGKKLVDRFLACSLQTLVLVYTGLQVLNDSV